jgi:GNAT superfamily N-acetyltransferase
MSIKEVTELLSSVGFSSPPAWLRPYHVLSNGQKFRCDLARLLALSSSSLVTGHSSLISVCDEFTSVVDRQVAQVGSAAIAKAIRKRGLKFLALTCHFDVTDWLQPDWIYRPDENTFSWRLLQRRPAIPLDIIRVAPSAWPLFAPHHYLSHDVNHSAACFFASVHGEPAAISSWLPFVGSGPSSRREHRTVVLPDYQGVGIGMALSDALASMWTALGYVARSTTTHPAFIAARRRSRNWRMVRSPRLGGRGDILKHATTRATAGFEYIGPPMEWIAATRLLAERL